MEFNHYSVMKEEAISYLNIDPNGIYVDMTAGGGGHSLEIVKRLDKGKLIAIDRDGDAVKFLEEKLKDYQNKVFIVKENFSNVKSIVEQKGIEKIHGALMDLGLSSYQISSKRGFSYMDDSELLMTMDETQNFTAAFLVNTYSEDKIKKILYEYGEERFSDRIAREIVKRRAEKPIETTLELVGIIEYALRGVRYEGGHKAKRSFQAIRCHVNQEMENIDPAIDSAVQMLVSGGRLAVISFHSGEDRIIKNNFRKHERPCECPLELPCVCGKKTSVKIITKKPIYPSEWERTENSRSNSAKLRVLEKL